MQYGDDLVQAFVYGLGIFYAQLTIVIWAKIWVKSSKISFYSLQ